MKATKRILLTILVLLVLAQLYRPEQSNPPVDPSKTLRATGTVSPDVQAILDRSCNDCHSNLTVWPWYAKIAPVSWFLASHVRDGRKEMNFSQWASYTDARKVHKIDSMCDEVRDGDMPLKTYLPLHPTAKLSDADRKTICAWSEQQLAAFAARGIKPGKHEH